MGYVHATIQLSNPREPALQPIQTRALADSGALMLCIPEHLAMQLRLSTESEREVTVAEGHFDRPLRGSGQGGLPGPDLLRGGAGAGR